MASKEDKDPFCESFMQKLLGRVKTPPTEGLGQWKRNSVGDLFRHHNGYRETWTDTEGTHIRVENATPIPGGDTYVDVSRGTGPAPYGVKDPAEYAYLTRQMGIEFAPSQVNAKGGKTYPSSVDISIARRAAFMTGVNLEPQDLVLDVRSKTKVLVTDKVYEALSTADDLVQASAAFVENQAPTMTKVRNALDKNIIGFPPAKNIGTPPPHAYFADAESKAQQHNSGVKEARLVFGSAAAVLSVALIFISTKIDLGSIINPINSPPPKPDNTPTAPKVVGESEKTLSSYTESSNSQTQSHSSEDTKSNQPAVTNPGTDPRFAQPCDRPGPSSDGIMTCTNNPNRTDGPSWTYITQ